MIRSRAEACRILGVGLYTTEQDIKAAYKNLVKIYHPDSGRQKDYDEYCRIVEAYEFLSANPIVAKPQRVMGSAYNPYSQKAEHAAFEKSYQKQKQAKKAAFEKHVNEYNSAVKQKQKQDEEYKKAMDAIHAILAAEAIKNMIKNKPES